MSHEEPVLAELRPIGILSYISPEFLEPLKYHGVFAEYQPGEIVVEENVQQQKLFFVISGRLEVFITKAGKEVIVGSINPGDCIGEVSIFEPGNASATVRCVDTCVLWYMDVESLQSFFEKLPVAGGQLMLGIAQLLSKRLKQVNEDAARAKTMPYVAVRSGRSPISYEQLATGKANTSDKDADGFFSLFKKKKSDEDNNPKIRTDIKI